jgi:hypothetical protein
MELLLNSGNLAALSSNINSLGLTCFNNVSNGGIDQLNNNI